MLCRGLTFEQTEQILKAKAKGLFVLVEGAVEILRRQPESASERIATVEAPTVVGEMSLLTDRPHSATVRTLTRCEGRLLTRSQFERLLINAWSL